MIEDIYTQLNQINLVKTQYEFSEKWLGKSKSYYSAIVSLKQPASVQVLTTLKLRLLELSMQLENSKRAQKYLPIEFSVAQVLNSKIATIDALISYACSHPISKY